MAANVLGNRPFGFTPVKHLNGSPYNGQARKYMIAAGDANPVAVGDLVVLSDQAAIGGYTAVEAVNAGTVTAAQPVGAVVALLPINESGGVSGGAGPVLDTPAGTYRAASVLRYCLVADSPDLIFRCQEDSVGGNIAAASIGLNAGFIAATPNTTSGMSNFTLDSSSVATTNSLPLQVLGSVQSPNNVLGNDYCQFLVRINTHAYGSVGATAV